MEFNTELKTKIKKLLIKLFINRARTLVHNICDKIINVSNYKAISGAIIKPRNSKSM